MALNCTGQACEAVDSPLLVKGSLLEPAAITPAYAAGPLGHDTPGCVAASQNPNWTLSTIYYYDQAGNDSVNSTAWQNFNLLVTNPANAYEANCIPGGPADTVGSLPSTVLLGCAGREFQSAEIDQYQLSTTASFDTTTFEFTLNQTWFCDDADPGKP